MYWHHSELYPSTDDAYIQAHVVNIAPQVSGPVSQIFAENYQHVKKGQKLFNIDRRPFVIAIHEANAQLQLAKQKMESANAAVKTAKANVLERKSQLTLAIKNARRILTLVKDGQMSKQEGDKITSDLQVARAGLTAAKNQLAESKAELGKLGNQNAEIREAAAKLAQAKLNLSYTYITAPTNGQLVNFKVRAGNMLEAGQTIFSIVDDSQWWVDANFKETNLLRIHPGQKAEIVADMYPDHTFKGRVYQISPGSGSTFSILPPENATGNWVKVTQRFPVRIMITHVSKKHPLRVGSSATVTVDTVN